MIIPFSFIPSLNDYSKYKEELKLLEKYIDLTQEEKVIIEKYLNNDFGVDGFEFNYIETKVSQILSKLNIKDPSLIKLYKYQLFISFYGDKNKFLDAFQTLQEIDPDYPVYLHYNIAYIKFDLKDYQGALIEFDKYISFDEDPDLNYYAKYFKALCKYYLGDKLAAIEEFNSCLDINPNHKDIYYNIAEIKYELGNTDEALEYAQKIISVDNKHRTAFELIFKIKYELGKFDELEKDLNYAISVIPEFIEAYQYRIKLKQNQNDYEAVMKDIIAIFKNNINLKPHRFLYLLTSDFNLEELYNKKDKKSEDYNRLASFEISSHNYSNAIEYLTKAIELGDETSLSTSYMQRGYAKFCLGDLNAALEDYKIADEYEKKDKHEESILLGDNSYPEMSMLTIKFVQRKYNEVIKYSITGAYFTAHIIKVALSRENLNDFNGALNEYDEILSIERTNKNFYFYRGCLKFYMKDYKGAADDLNIASEEFIFPFEYFMLGLANFLAKNYSDAVTAFTKVIEIDPVFFMSYRFRADAYRQIGDLNSAMSDYVKAAELDEFKQINWISNDTDYNDIDYFNRLKEKQPNNPTYYFSIGYCKFLNKDFQGAIDEYNKAIELDNSLYKVYNNRANAKYYIGDYEGAIEDYNKALEFTPNEGFIYYNRGNAKLALKDFNAALDDYNIASEKEFYDVKLNKAIAYEFCGEKLKAYDELCYLIEKSKPNVNPLYYFLRGNINYKLGHQDEAPNDWYEAINSGYFKKKSI
ncbi:MAG TPA: tetratricopeptide repeat protein [Ignavibacteriales bacterium]|nr:tetratricopeptide repeat protein [Ignavibacteriales bacterium]